MMGIIPSVPGFPACEFQNSLPLAGHIQNLPRNRSNRNEPINRAICGVAERNQVTGNDCACSTASCSARNGHRLALMDSCVNESNDSVYLGLSWSGEVVNWLVTIVEFVT